MGCSWYDVDAKALVESRKSLLSKEEFQTQVDRAEIQAKETLRWTGLNGYSGKPKECYWSARSGVIKKVTGIDVNQKNNPSDILTKFENDWLGISVKSSSTRQDVAFKNPGLGTIDSLLGLNLSLEFKSATAEIVSSLRLPSSADVRKAYIRKNPDIQKITISTGDKLLETFRNVYFYKLESLDQSKIRKFIIDNWTNSDIQNCFPRYIKVTGTGNGKNICAKVEDPFNNPKHFALLREKIYLKRLGRDSVGISTDSMRIMIMRFKFESEKMASSIKLSGDPWK